MNLAPFEMDCSNNAGGDGSSAGINHKSQDGILRVSVQGSIALSDLTVYVTRHQEDWVAHDKVCWDLRHFDPSGITSSDILNIRHAFGEILEQKGSGRSAIVVSKELDLVTRVAMSLSENQQGPITIRSLLDLSEALSWLVDENPESR